MNYSFAYAELAGLWIEAGGNGTDAAVAAAIATAESKGCPYAKAGPTDDRPVRACDYRYTTSENSYGLWQINRDAHPQYTAAQLYDPLANAKAAVAISHDGADFGPWTTYTDGAYKQYVESNFTPTIPDLSPGLVTESGSLSSGSGAGITSAQVSTAWMRLMHALVKTGTAQHVGHHNAGARIRRAVR